MEVRYLIIESEHNLDKGEVPFIRLLGKWLDEMGFKAGRSVRLEIAPE